MNLGHRDARGLAWRWRGLAEWMLAWVPYGQHREMDLTETRVEQTSAQTPA